MNDVTAISVASPFYHPIVSMLSPKTPGGPLREVRDEHPFPRSIQKI